MNDCQIRSCILNEIRKERQRQIDVSKHGGDTNSFDQENTKNDWVSFIAAYSGRAASRCSRNETQGLDFRQCMIKTAALAMAAIEAHDKGFC